MPNERMVSVALVVARLRKLAKEHLDSAEQCRRDEEIASRKRGWHMNAWAELDNEATYLERGTGGWQGAVPCDGEHPAPACDGEHPIPACDPNKCWHVASP